MTVLATHSDRELVVSPLVWIGIVLVVLWAALWLGLHIVAGIVHLLVILGVALLLWGLVRKGARAVSDR